MACPWIDIWLQPAGTDVRHVLANYLHCEPARIVIEPSDSGRPLLSGASHADAPWFNVSHARSWSIVAVSSVQVGVDLELIDDPPAKLAHVNRYLAAEEEAALRDLGTVARSDALLRLWTCKEAYAKATGMGLRLPLDSFACSVEPSPRVLRTHDGGDWSIQGLDLPWPLVGTVAWSGGSGLVRMRTGSPTA